MSAPGDSAPRPGRDGIPAVTTRPVAGAGVGVGAGAARLAMAAMDPSVRWEKELTDAVVLRDFQAITAQLGASLSGIRKAFGTAKTVGGAYAAFVVMHSHPIFVRLVNAAVHQSVLDVFGDIQSSLIKMVNMNHLQGFYVNQNNVNLPPIAPFNDGVANKAVVDSTLPLLASVSCAVPFPCIELSYTMSSRLEATCRHTDVFQYLSTFSALSQLLEDAKVQDLIWVRVVAFCLDLYPYVHTSVAVTSWPARLRNSVAHNQAASRSQCGDMLLFNVRPQKDGDGDNTEGSKSKKADSKKAGSKKAGSNHSHDWVMSIETNKLRGALKALYEDLQTIWRRKVYVFARKGKFGSFVRGKHT